MSEVEETLLELDHGLEESAWPGQERQLFVGQDEQERRTAAAALAVPVGAQVVPERGPLRVVAGSQLGPVLVAHRPGQRALLRDRDLVRVRLGVTLDELVEGLTGVGIVVRHAVDRRTSQPEFEGVAQAGDVFELLLHPPVGRRLPAQVVAQGVEVVALDPERNPLLLVETHQDLDLSQLGALESRSRHELVAEREVALGRQGLDHLEVLDTSAQDRDDPLAPVDRAGHLALIDPFRAEQVSNRGQLAQDELEPELVDLVHRDEEDLVVAQGRLVVLKPALQGQQVVDTDVVPVVRAALRSGHGSRDPRVGDRERRRSGRQCPGQRALCRTAPPRRRPRSTPDPAGHSSRTAPAGTILGPPPRFDP